MPANGGKTDSWNDTFESVVWNPVKLIQNEQKVEWECFLGPNVTHLSSEKMAVTLPGYLSEWISLRSLVSGWVSNNRMLCCNRFRSPKDAAVTCRFTRMYWNCKIKMLLLLVNLSESSHFHYFWSFFVFFVHILEHLKLFDFFWLFWKLWIYK